MARIFGVFCLAGLLAGCVNGRFQGGPVLDLISDYTGLGGEEAAPEAAESIGPPLIVGYNDIRVAVPMVRKAGRSREYVAPDGAEIAMIDGFVTRAIGLGIDLEGAFLPAKSPYFEGFVEAAARNDTTERVAEYWSKGRIKRSTYLCRLSLTGEAEARIVEERCKLFFGDEGFHNRYWINADDQLVCSRQWFHPDGDYLQFFSTEQQALTLDLRKDGC